MSRIQLLSELVASQVAAGEVIERPASVVKELVENSIDAGAKKIEVMIRRGGSSLIRVVDDGSGMDRDDALLCLERHATSKIRSGHDLAAISTLGFRGEAIPSIASVSKFRLATREHQALAGTEVLVSGGKIEQVRDGGDAPGTQIEVRSLFFNLPARRKFLRTENTESSHVEHQLHLQAIGHPEIGFVFVNDERVVFQLPPAGLHDRIRDLCGADLAGELLKIKRETIDGITFYGFIGKPGVSRSSRAQQLVFLNGRAVENSTLNFGLREGYHTALMKGQHPVTFLFLEMDPGAVDVNVHPAKREIRFRDGMGVRNALVEVVRKTLESGRKGWEQTFQPQQPAAAPVPLEQPQLIETRQQVTLRRDWSALPLQPQRPSSAIPAGPSNPTDPTDPSDRTDPHSTPAPSQQDFKILGVLGKLYVLMENSAGLVLVDQHAAHERILFEELHRRMAEQGVPAQQLLIPLTLQVSPKDADWILQNKATLQRMGIGIEEFGAGTFKVDTLPQFVKASQPYELLREIIDELRETSVKSSSLRLGEDVIAKTVCRAAVKANDYLREPELVKLIQDLLACELPYCCPHGRPTMIQMSYYELEKKFGRKV